MATYRRSPRRSSWACQTRRFGERVSVVVPKAAPASIPTRCGSRSADVSSYKVPKEFVMPFDPFTHSAEGAACRVKARLATTSIRTPKHVRIDGDPSPSSSNDARKRWRWRPEKVARQHGRGRLTARSASEPGRSGLGSSSSGCMPLGLSSSRRSHAWGRNVCGVARLEGRFVRSRHRRNVFAEPPDAR